MHIRDFDRESYEARRKYVLDVVELMRVRHKRARIEASLEDVYGNISSFLGDDMSPVDLMYEAVKELGIEPKTIAMRGGTDGSVLSARGLITPNYFTGGLNFHSYAEFLPVPSLCRSLDMTLKILELAARKALPKQ